MHSLPPLTGVFDDIHLQGHEGLDVRVAQLEDRTCFNPLCGCHGGEARLVLFADTAKEPPRWVLGTVAKNPVDALGDLADEQLDWIHRLAILYGMPWSTLMVKLETVLAHQVEAAAETPQRYRAMSLEDVRLTAALINDVHPRSIAHLLNIAEVWAADVGGTNCATPT